MSMVRDMNIHNGDSHKRKGTQLSVLEKLRDALTAKIQKVVDRIAEIDAKKASLNDKLALCPTPTPSPSPTATPVV